MRRTYAHEPCCTTETDELPVFQHVALMSRLEDWMPKQLKFCHHCLLYLPRYNFGPSDEDLDMLQCMDCKYFSTVGLKNEYHRLSPLPCEGCFFARLVEEEQQEDPAFWGHLADLKGPLIADPWDLTDDYNASMVVITDPAVREKVRNLQETYPIVSVWECYEALLENDGDSMKTLLALVRTRRN